MYSKFVATRWFRIRTCAVLILCLMSALWLQEAQAWGATGHRLVSRLALEVLPAEIPVFLRTSRAARIVGELGREPDRSKGSGESHDHDLDPGHYINLADDFSVAGVLPLDPLPASREAYDSALRTSGFNEYRVGFLPYSIVDGWQQLRKDFAFWRALSAAERSVKSRREKAWLARDRRLRELIIVRDLGYWSHFVADASQPMHVSMHHDGWGDFPNPRGYANRKAFHADFEGAFVAAHVSPADILARLREPRDCNCSIQVRTITYIRETHDQQAPLFELEKAGAFSENSTMGREFVAGRLAAAVSELRDLIHAAWRMSLDSKVGHPPVPVRDIVAGKVNPVRQLQGLD